MGKVDFQTQMAGGDGNLQVSFDKVAGVLNFDQDDNDPKEVILPQGANGYTNDVRRLCLRILYACSL